MQTQNLIEEQITNCRELLKIFKDERETYGDSSSINLDQVVIMIKRKQEILTTFSRQKEIMQGIKEHGHQNEETEKKLLRELGGILEQLLVIDQENEVLLKNLLRKRPVDTTKSSQTSSISQTPDLPFCPGKRRQPRKVKQTVSSVKNDVKQADLLQNKLNHFSRNKLRAYGA
ncbi:MAG: hypothetical protein MK132_00355 [Lentisphaerales bacterium]|nr:hypothetical protein [Lentisphaerales bacterium]